MKTKHEKILLERVKLLVGIFNDKDKPVGFRIRVLSFCASGYFVYDHDPNRENKIIVKYFRFLLFSCKRL